MTTRRDPDVHAAIGEGPSSPKWRSDCPGAGPTVVIPVHNAFDELRACLESVAATVAPDKQVIVIDDASTDERIVPMVKSVMEYGGPLWRLVRQPRNQGFVETANLGIRLSQTDVVLLNSDTEVTPGWLERMGACLAGDESIATCTPWSNNSEITSIPGFCKANPVPLDPASVSATIAEAVAASGGPEYPEIPTAVGFCMGISRRGLEVIGTFDSERFGRGYGEENDYSLRARERGLRNVLCDDVYVIHRGGRSFGPLGMRPDEGSMQRLLERHPHYREEIAAFIRDDPLAPLRERLCAAVNDAGLSFN